MQQGSARDWGIIGASVMEDDRAMRQKLLSQDCLTTLIELDPDDGGAAEIIGPMKVSRSLGSPATSVFVLATSISLKRS